MLHLASGPSDWNIPGFQKSMLGTHDMDKTEKRAE